MTPAQVLPYLLNLNLAMLKEAPKNPNTTSPHYHPNARCAYHSESPGHDTNNCWALKNKIQDVIDVKEVEFEAPKKPNIISTFKVKELLLWWLDAKNDTIHEAKDSLWSKLVLFSFVCCLLIQVGVEFENWRIIWLSSRLFWKRVNFKCLVKSIHGHFFEIYDTFSLSLHMS